MHYKNGREAKNGDLIIHLSSNPGDRLAAGVLTGAKAEGGSDCNGVIIPWPMTSVHYADLKNCLHIDDIAAATIPDSTQAAT